MNKKYMLRHFVLRLLMCMVTLSCLSAHLIAEEPEPKLVSHFVAVSQGADLKVKQAANDFAVYLGHKGAASFPKNPVCCYWVEIDEDLGAFGKDCYVILLGENGGLIKGTNAEQVMAALEKLKPIVVKKDGKSFLPAERVITNVKKLAVLSDGSSR